MARMRVANRAEVKDDPASPGSSPSGDGHQLTEAVTRLRRSLRASIRTDFPWEALPMAQVELMQTLAEDAPARVSDLAERLNLANSTVSGLVSQMIGTGLVIRETDSADRRAAVVTLSAAGRQELAGWQDAHEQRIGAALDRLAPADRAAVTRALPALNRLAALLAEPPPPPA
jgi:DNA-binding MarR family transcriptional regulator